MTFTKVRHNTLRRYLKFLRLNKEFYQNRKHKTRNLLGIFRKYHLHREINKFKNICYLIKEAERQDSTPGSYQMIKELNERLLDFQYEVQQVIDLKANKVDLELLREHTDKQRLLYLFEEMKDMYDQNIQKQWSFLKSIENHFNKKSQELVETINHHVTSSSGLKETMFEFESKLGQME